MKHPEPTATVSSNVITITVYAVLTGGTVGSQMEICVNTAIAPFSSSALPYRN